MKKLILLIYSLLFISTVNGQIIQATTFYGQGEAERYYEINSTSANILSYQVKQSQFYGDIEIEIERKSSDKTVFVVTRDKALQFQLLFFLENGQLVLRNDTGTSFINWSKQAVNSDISQTEVGDLISNPYFELIWESFNDLLEFSDAYDDFATIGSEEFDVTTMGSGLNIVGGAFGGTKKIACARAWHNLNPLLAGGMPSDCEWYCETACVKGDFLCMALITVICP